MELKEVLEKLESKERETKGFIEKYRIRNMNELSKYNEGANWALNFAIALLKKHMESN